VIADYRTREDFRRLNSGFSVRLRERLQIQRDFTIADYTFTPYASSEVFLHALWRVRALSPDLGGHPAGHRHISIEPYLVRQVDWLPGIITNALGFIAIATF